MEGISANLPPDLDSMTQCIGTVVAAVGAQEELPAGTQVCNLMLQKTQT